MNRAGGAGGAFSMEKMELANRPDSETTALVELSKVDLENRRVKAMSRAATAMMASTAVLLVLVLGLIVTVAVMMSRINDTLSSIADSVGPSAVATAVSTLQSSLDNVQGTTGNFLSLSGDAELMGSKLLEAANQSISILSNTNQMAENLLAHPTIRMDLGGANR